MNHNPAQVSQWLSSMLNIIPGDILSLLSQRVKAHQIGGHTFSGMLNNHEFFTEMGIEGLTMLHCSRIRKVWHQDFPDTRNITLDRRPGNIPGAQRGGSNRNATEQQTPDMPVAGMRPPGGRNPTSRMHQLDDGSQVQLDPRLNATVSTNDPRLNTTFSSSNRHQQQRGPADVDAAHREETLRMAQQIQKLRADLELGEQRARKAEEERDQYKNSLDMAESRNRALTEQMKELADLPRKVFERVCDQAGLDKAQMYPGSRDLLRPAQQSDKGRGHGGGGAGGSQGPPLMQNKQPRGPPGGPPAGPQLGGRIVGDPFDPNAPPIHAGAPQPQQRGQRPQMQSGGGGGVPTQPGVPQSLQGTLLHQQLPAEGEKQPPPPAQRPGNPFDELPASAHHRSQAMAVRDQDDQKETGRTSSSRGNTGQGREKRFNPSFDESEEIRQVHRAEEKAQPSTRAQPQPKAAKPNPPPPNIPANSRAGGKSPGKVIDWIKSLPDAFVPEKIKDQMCGAVDMRGIDGQQFTQLVLSNQLQSVGVVSPLQVSKIVKAWKNVLAEDQMSDAAKQTLDNQPTGKKAVKLIC
ncbi:unnamed protein product [Amoebophrya sp. A120]|nr:unnamed protein product [Amoebophrya sp. A120]|eukprot:GSA120T00021662001.1